MAGQTRSPHLTASQRTVKTVLASKARLTPEAEQIKFQVIAVEYAGLRPASRDIGRFVHALLESCNPSTAENIVELHGRWIGAAESEVIAESP
jgi:hypothetical protein